LQNIKLFTWIGKQKEFPGNDNICCKLKIFLIERQQALYNYLLILAHCNDKQIYIAV